MTGRYEFRCWPEKPLPAGDILKNEWETRGEKDATDVYILSPVSNRFLVKLRESLIDAKVFRGRRGALEHWDEHAKIPFPVSRRDVEQGVFPILGLRGAAGEGIRDQEDFLGRFVPAHPALDALRVVKDRVQFARGDCLAETVIVDVGDARYHSLAVESGNPEAVLKEIEALGLEGLKNLNYGRF